MAAHNPPLDADATAMPKQEPVPDGDRSRTAAHLASTVLTALGHVSRHLSAASEAGNPASREFNLEHARRHVAEGLDHHRKLITILSRHHPGFGDEFSKLDKTTEPPPARSGRVRLPARYPEVPADYDAGLDRGPRPA